MDLSSSLIMNISEAPLLLSKTKDPAESHKVNPIMSSLSHCNTPGVCHQLSNGFELKHGMLSGNEGVKIKSTRVSSNLNLDNTPLLTMCTLVKIMQE